MDYITVSIDKLKPYEKNARKHSAKQIALIAQSIERYDFMNPFLVDEDFMILAGHGRLEAAKQLGIKEVPCIQASHLTEDQKREYILADNRLAELADLKINFAELGFDSSFLPKDHDKLGDEDAVPAIPATPITKHGDIWTLGDHRVMCGDSTSGVDIGRLMKDHRADCIWTDPPYNVDYNGKAGKIKNDAMPDEKFGAFLADFYAAAFDVLNEGAAIYVAHADLHGRSADFILAAKNAGFHLQNCLIWAKESLVLGRSDYQWQHEPILYGWKPGKAHNWFGGRKQTTVRDFRMDGVSLGEDGDLIVAVSGRTFVIKGTDMTFEEILPSVFNHDKPKRSGEHPTMKPVSLIEPMLNNSTIEGHFVLDPFGGSGSTLIACEKIARRAFLMELDPKFVDVIVKRWQDFTGRQAVHAETGTPFNG